MVVNPNDMVGTFLKLSPYSKIQQSGIDVSLKSIKKLLTDRTIIFHPDYTLQYDELRPGAYDNSFHLSPGDYDFECNEYVKVPSNCIALLIQRSSLNRCGAFITTGLYDNGFENYVGGVLHCNAYLAIPVNSRIAQIVFMETEHEAQYKGRYQRLTESMSKDDLISAPAKVSRRTRR